ncbi:C6 finger domain-containing protein [Colletotrichum higginsianum IMI 349063]|uniref:C6 finger domain-containing protein n=1 Tax=Colletotrichum higginsianum (strain IMI 349063) TaxID=759273 RepID=A0A1B7YWJ6_COLHI|nr:C6 finger domain-containing protein [Colletotrichum higginsianum IMI 349063]OBR16411.1 C6 finger domain-containing protein [Colletotrichum higginsianum IMI 349063]GJC91349.1 C6 finger domain-containing protein [Colletotrichum higginsianum]
MSRNSSDRADGSALQSPIACESCRQRKRRVSQGIPNGYLNRLETRLAETEAALFRALSGALDGGPTSLDSASSPALLPQAAWTPRQNKVDRVKEWDSLPLQTPDDIQAWFRSKATEHNDAAIDLPAASPQSLISSVSDPMFAPPPPLRDPGSSVPDHQSISDSVIEPQLRSVTPVITTPVGRSPADAVSKAKELSKSQQNLYF